MNILSTILKKFLRSIFFAILPLFFGGLFFFIIIILIATPFTMLLGDDTDEMSKLNSYIIDGVADLQAKNDERTEYLEVDEVELYMPPIEYTTSLVHLRKFAPLLQKRAEGDALTDSEVDEMEDFEITTEDFTAIYSSIYYRSTITNTVRVRNGHKWVSGSSSDYDKKIPQYNPEREITGYIYKKKVAKYKDEEREAVLFFNFTQDEVNRRYIDKILDENPGAEREFLEEQLSTYAKFIQETVGKGARVLQERDFLSPIGRTEVIVTCPFGWRIHPILHTKDFHSAIDIATNQEDPWYAIADGVVTAVGMSKRSGLYVRYETDNGYEVHYSHNFNVLVEVGERIEAGQQISVGGGAKGTYGAGVSTGSHIHFRISEIKEDGTKEAKDPLLFY